MPRHLSLAAICLQLKRLSVAEHLLLRLAASQPRWYWCWCCCSFASWWLPSGGAQDSLESWRWRSFATTSLWLLIFMILLFNGSFVCASAASEFEYVSGFQFSYRCLYIFHGLFNVCLIFIKYFYIFLVFGFFFVSKPSSPALGAHLMSAGLNLSPWGAS